MKALGAIRIALAALRLNALRSLLAMLGIIIGVASVILMVSIGNTARRQVDAQIAALGTNTLQILPGSFSFGGRQSGAGTSGPFSTTDLQAIAGHVPGIAAISGVTGAPTPIVRGAKNWTAQVVGVDVPYFDVRDWPVAEGRIFTDAEARSGARVIVLGASTVAKLFGEDDPIGGSLRIRNAPFEVIGVLTVKGQSMLGTDQDDIGLIPALTARRRLFGSQRTIPNMVRSMTVKVERVEDIATVQADIEELLRQRRRVRPGEEDNFQVRNMAEFVRARTSTMTTFGLLLGATAVISLVVGGIGIMNIMLVSVTERTREIGLRMAVGARSRDILGQFLVEAVTLCAAGGTLGIVLGIAGTLSIARIGAWSVSLDPLVVLTALASSALVGVFFGFYPARKASQLNPIDALRHE